MLELRANYDAVVQELAAILLDQLGNLAPTHGHLQRLISVDALIKLPWQVDWSSSTTFGRLLHRALVASHAAQYTTVIFRSNIICLLQQVNILIELGKDHLALGQLGASSLTASSTCTTRLSATA